MIVILPSCRELLALVVIGLVAFSQQSPSPPREIFTAARGTHEDFDEYDQVMAEERRVAVLVEPERVYGSS
jgi:hypothetical protein